MEVLLEKKLRKNLEKIYIEQHSELVNEKWNRLSKEDKMIVLEMFKILNPKIKFPINEATWWNTVGDWAGMIPIIGSPIDLINGISYWRQGDKLFAILSFIGAIPVFGDLIATPIINILKMGGRSAELVKTAILTKNSVKLAETANKIGGPVAKMVETSPKWGAQLIEVLEKTVGRFPKLGTGLVETVKEWVNVFTKAKTSTDVFKTMGRPAVRKLMQDTKFYLNLLDYLGMGNFSGGPEELAKQVPDLESKIAEYEKSLKSDSALGSEPDSKTNVTPPPPSSSISLGGIDPIDLFLDELLS
jgi:hypothetical protein